MRAIVASAVLVVLPASAMAQDSGPVSPPRSTGYSVTLGVEGRYLPRWDGANDMRFVPVPIVNVRPAGSPHRFSSPRDGISIGLIDTGEFRIGPTGKLRTKRKASDDPKLAGLGDVDWTVELGIFAEYWVQPWLRTRAELLQGIGGHRGLVGELTADAVWRATPQLTLSAGPRMTVVSAEAVRPYFSVDPQQSIASGLPVYDARGGIYSYGFGTQARFALTPRWTTSLYAEYERLAGSAADAPLVVRRGSRDQWTLGAGLSYTFDVDWRW